MGNVVITPDTEIDMVTYSFEGPTNYDDIRVEIDRYYSGKLTKYKICDFTNAKLDVTSNQVVLLAEQIRARGAARKNCFDAVVVPNLLYFGLARMYVAYAEFTKDNDPDALKLMIYRSMDEAIAKMKELYEKKANV